MKKLINIPERLDPYDTKINPAEKILHISRYEYAAKTIRKLQHNKKTTILDAACGLGYGSNILQNQTQFNVVGIDHSSSLVNYLIKKNKNRKIKFIKTDIKILPFPDQSIDYIVCFETIEHLKKTDGIKTIVEFRRVLKKNGLIIISSPNYILTRLIKKIFPKYNNPFHLYEYQPNELEELLKKNKLQIIESCGQYFFFPFIYIFPIFLFFFNFIFKPSKFFPLCLFHYFIITAKKNYIKI